MLLRRGSLIAGSSLLLLLAGCALPVPVVMASYAVDGISYLGTGKTVTDHALSLATDQDCRLWRAVGGEPVCVEPGPPDVGPATDDPAMLVSIPRPTTRPMTSAPVAAVAVIPADAPPAARAALTGQQPAPPARQALSPSPAPAVAGIPVPPAPPTGFRQTAQRQTVDIALPPPVPDRRQHRVQVASFPRPPQPVR